jgi:hypothetical protein
MKGGFGCPGNQLTLWQPRELPGGVGGQFSLGRSVVGTGSRGWAGRASVTDALRPGEKGGGEVWRGGRDEARRAAPRAMTGLAIRPRTMPDREQPRGRASGAASGACARARAQRQNRVRASHAHLAEWRWLFLTLRWPFPILWGGKDRGDAGGKDQGRGGVDVGAGAAAAPWQGHRAARRLGGHYWYWHGARVQRVARATGRPASRRARVHGRPPHSRFPGPAPRSRAAPARARRPRALTLARDGARLQRGRGGRWGAGGRGADGGRRGKGGAAAARRGRGGVPARGPPARYAGRAQSRPQTSQIKLPTFSPSARAPRSPHAP